MGAVIRTHRDKFVCDSCARRRFSVQIRFKRLWRNIDKVFSPEMAKLEVWRFLSDKLEARRDTAKLADVKISGTNIKDTMRFDRLHFPENQRRAVALDALVLEWVTEGKKF
jgi:hypothetical protein